MAAEATGAQFAGFLGDLRLVACLGASLLYATWVVSGRESLVNLARLGLVVAFGASVLTYALALVPLATMPFLDLFLFVILAAFLLLEFLFKLSVLGVGVSVLATAIAALPYVLSPFSTPLMLAPTNAVVAYWSVIRDLLTVLAAAGLCFATAGGVLLHAAPDRRGSKLVHPNDLRDATALMIRMATPTAALAVVAGAVALLKSPAAPALVWWRLGLLVGLVVAAGLWLFRAESRDWTRGPIYLLALLNGVLIASLLGADVVLAHLTPAPKVP